MADNRVAHTVSTLLLKLTPEQKKQLQEFTGAEVPTMLVQRTVVDGFRSIQGSFLAW